MLLTLLRSGAVAAVTCTGAITLDGVVVDGAGTSTILAAGAITLDGVDVAGSGTSTIVSAGAITLDSVDVVGAGEVLTLLPGPLVGHLDCSAAGIEGLTMVTPGATALDCRVAAVAPVAMVCTVAAGAMLGCVVNNAWAFPAVSFTRSLP